MNHRMKSVLQTLSWVKSFAEAPEIPANPRATRLLADITALIGRMEEAARDQVNGASSRKRNTLNRNAIAGEIIELMRAINRTAKSLDDAPITNLASLFRMPTSQAFQPLLCSARAFLEHVVPIKDLLIESGLPADFDVHLQTLIDQFAAATIKAEVGRTTLITGTTILGTAVRQGSALIRKMDAVMKNILRDQPELLSTWKHVAHIERPPKRQKNADEIPSSQTEGSEAAVSNSTPGEPARVPSMQIANVELPVPVPSGAAEPKGLESSPDLPLRIETTNESTKILRTTEDNNANAEASTPLTTPGGGRVS